MDTRRVLDMDESWEMICELRWQFVSSSSVEIGACPLAQVGRV